MWNRLKRVEAAALPAISADDAKKHLNVLHDDDDAYIADLVAAAQAAVEGPNGVGLALLTQTWRASLDCWPASLTLPLGPVQAVSEITYVDAAGAEQTLAAAAYRVDTDAEPCRVSPAYGQCWPAVRRQIGVIKVVFTAGYGADPGDVPGDLRQALLMIVGHWYENRGLTAADREMPWGASQILDRYRVGLAA